MAETMKVYTLEELVDLLKVTKRTLYNYIRTGRLKAVKMGKYWQWLVNKQKEMKRVIII